MAYQPIRLLDYQEPHLTRLIEIFKINMVGLDYSRTGDGKTYVTSALATLFELPILVISMPTVLTVWQEMKEQHGLQILDMISYDLLRGRANTGCNNKYLIRTKEGRFLITDYFRILIQQGIFIVFDEISKMKNMKTAIHKAAHTIIKELVMSKSRSRAILLSAMPCDKLSHVISLMRLQGIIFDDKIFDYDRSRRKYVFYGLQEVVDWCSKQDHCQTVQVIQQNRISNKTDIAQLAVSLYSNIIARRLSSCMKLDRVKIDIKNGYYYIHPEDMEALDIGGDLLRKAVKWHNEDSLEIDYGQVDWPKLSLGLRYLGAAKLRTVCRLTYYDLMADSNCKVIIGCWYITQIKWLTQVFRYFGAQSLYGSLTMKERQRIINLFQQPDNTCRVLVVNPTVGGIGINLDDRHGLFARKVKLIPDYRLMESVQLFGRVDRNSTKLESKLNTTARFVYAKGFSGETKILAALLRKSNYARTVIFNDTGLTLPDEYSAEEEQSAPTDYLNLSTPPLPAK